MPSNARPCMQASTKSRQRRALPCVETRGHYYTECTRWKSTKYRETFTQGKKQGGGASQIWKKWDKPQWLGEIEEEKKKNTQDLHQHAAQRHHPPEAADILSSQLFSFFFFFSFCNFGCAERWGHTVLFQKGTQTNASNFTVIWISRPTYDKEEPSKIIIYVSELWSKESMNACACNSLCVCMYCICVCLSICLSVGLSVCLVYFASRFVFCQPCDRKSSRLTCATCRPSTGIYHAYGKQAFKPIWLSIQR